MYPLLALYMYIYIYIYIYISILPNRGFLNILMTAELAVNVEVGTADRARAHGRRVCFVVVVVAVVVVVVVFVLVFV